MRKSFYSLALALCALMLAMPVWANHIDISGLAGLRAAMANPNGAFEPSGYRVSAADTIRLVADIDEDLKAEDLLYLADISFATAKAQGLTLESHTGIRFFSGSAVIVRGKKHLDLNGHSIRIAYFDDPSGAVISLFKTIDIAGLFTISDTQGGGKIIMRAPYSANSHRLCAISSPFTALKIFGGEISAEYIWSGGGNFNYGVYTLAAALGGEVSVYGGKIHRMHAKDIDYINICGGETDGFSVIADNDGVTAPQNGHMKFYNGTVANMNIGRFAGDEAAKEVLPKSWQVKQFVSAGSIVGYDDFAHAFAAGIGSFAIKNLNFYPVVVNGDVNFSETNPGDILGDGSVGFDEATNTLTLNNARINKLELRCFDQASNPEMIIRVNGTCRINGSGIKCTGAHLSIEGTDGDTLIVFGAGCKAIECDNQLLLHNLAVDASASTTNAIAATTLILDGGSLHASAQNRAVACDISFWNDRIYTYTYNSGSATSAAFDITTDYRKFKIWIAGKQMSILNAYPGTNGYVPFLSDNVTGEPYINSIRTLDGDNPGKMTLYLEDVTIDTRDMREDDPHSFAGKGVPAVRIEEDSVTVFIGNTVIYSGDHTGVKPEGLDNRYYADGGHGIWFNPAKQNACEPVIRTAAIHSEGDNGDLYINTYGEYQSSYPIRCEGSRLYVYGQTGDSIVLDSKLPLYCKTGLTLDDATVFSRGGFKTSNTPTLNDCFIAWPRAAQFNSTGGVTGSTDNANNGVLVLNNDILHNIPYTVEPNDETMGYCTPTSFVTRYGQVLSISAHAYDGYAFKEWHVYRKGKAGHMTITDASTTVTIQSETRCVAFFELAAGDPETYPVWLNNVQVTSANCLNPAGDAKSEYKHQDGLGQITLNGVNWSTGGQAVYTAMEGAEIRLYCNGDNSVRGQSDWTMFFDQPSIVRIYFDTLRVGFNNPDEGAGIYLSRWDTQNGVLELRNRLTHISGTTTDHVAIAADTLRLLDGSILVVDNAGMEIRADLQMPADYMIYPAGTYRADDGTMRDASNNYVHTFRIAPKDPVTPKYTITVGVNDPAMGSATGGGIFDEGEDVVLTATANAGYEFVRWSNGSTDNPFRAPACMDADITAIFRVSAEAVPAVSADAPAAVKLIRNGQLFILRDGKMYNAMGVEVESK